MSESEPWINRVTNLNRIGDVKDTRYPTECQCHESTGEWEGAGGEGEGDEDAKKFEIWKRPFS